MHFKEKKYLLTNEGFNLCDLLLPELRGWKETTSFGPPPLLLLAAKAASGRGQFEERVDELFGVRHEIENSIADDNRKRNTICNRELVAQVAVLLVPVTYTNMITEYHKAQQHYGDWSTKDDLGSSVRRKRLPFDDQDAYVYGQTSDSEDEDQGDQAPSAASAQPPQPKQLCLDRWVGLQHQIPGGHVQHTVELQP